MRRKPSKFFEWTLKCSIQEACQNLYSYCLISCNIQEKAVTHPTDVKLLNRVRERLVKKVRSASLKLRESYVPVGPRQLLKVNRYAQARQIMWMKGEVTELRTILARVVRDVGRKTGKIANPSVQQLMKMGLVSEQAKRVLALERTSRKTVYSVHALGQERIKGKAHKRYEFGVKMCVAATNRSNFTMNGLVFPGNLYAGRTLTIQLGQVERGTGQRPDFPGLTIVKQGISCPANKEAKTSLYDKLVIS